MALRVTVCVWDPGHTLARVEAQQRALADGTIAGLIRKHGEGTLALRSALAKARLMTTAKSLDGTLHCPECGSLMDEVLASEGIKDKVEAVRDVAQDFEAAIVRTREARSA